MIARRGIVQGHLFPAELGGHPAGLAAGGRPLRLGAPARRGVQLASNLAGAGRAELIDDLGAYILGLATLRQSPDLADVLMLYALLVLAAPGALAVDSLAEAQSMQPIHVLVIDDDEQLTDFLRRALAYAGFTVDVANTGEAGLERARLHPPDVVILDVVLPGLDGLAVGQRLRAASDVPILMLTAKNTLLARLRGRGSGADDYLPKPFALADLIARLEALARR